MKTRYLNPQINVIEVKTEGFICDSRTDYEQEDWD